MKLAEFLPVLLLGGLLACQKLTDVVPPDGTPPTTDSLRATPTTIGKPIGAPVAQTIGPAGGTMTTPDGKLSLSFPAGAIRKETTITVQPGENNAPNGVGLAFTISPNITFEQDVTVIYYYRDDEMDGAAVDALGIAYQDGRQAWQQTQTAIADKARKTVTAKLRKGNWWALITQYKLEPEQTTVVRGETKELTLTKLADWHPGTTGDVSVAPLLLDKAINDVSKFYINGVDWTSAAPKDQNLGTIELYRQTGTLLYTAPDKKPKDPVTVTVEIKNPGSNAQFLLSSHITVSATENFLIIDGHTYSDIFVETGGLVGDAFFTVATGKDSLGHIGQLAISIDNFSVGDHLLTAGTEEKAGTYIGAETGIEKDNQEGTSFYGTCEKPETEKGTIQVVSIEPANNGFRKERLLITGRVVTVHEVDRQTCTVTKHKTMSVSAGLSGIFR